MLPIFVIDLETRILETKQNQHKILEIYFNTPSDKTCEVS